MVNDIKTSSFWDRIPFLKPYALLARWDRPIGFWLLFWPCVWGLALAPNFKTLSYETQIKFVLLFLVGAIVMRGAGCTLNDIYDRKLDAKVARTKTRPLASGQVSPLKAVLFLDLQLIIGACILFMLPPMAIYLGIATLPLIALYPLMKRFFWGPQFILGLNFASGALIGYATMENTIHLPAIILYLAGIAWVVAYDTVYAHMDANDDAVIGIKSTALWWGIYSKLITGWLWLAAFVLFAIALYLSDAIWGSYVMLGLAAAIQFTAHVFWNPEDSTYSLMFFRLQHRVGMVLALSALAPVLF